MKDVTLVQGRDVLALIRTLPDDALVNVPDAYFQAHQCVLAWYGQTALGIAKPTACNEYIATGTGTNIPVDALAGRIADGYDTHFFGPYQRVTAGQFRAALPELFMEEQDGQADG